MIKVSSQRDPLVMWGCQCCSQDLRYYPDRSGHCHSSSPSEASALFSKVLCQPLSTGTALMRQFGPGKVSAGWEVHISSASPFFFQHTCWTTAPVQSLAMNQEKALAPLLSSRLPGLSNQTINLPHCLLLLSGAERGSGWDPCTRATARANQTITKAWRSSSSGAGDSTCLVSCQTELRLIPMVTNIGRGIVYQ